MRNQFELPKLPTFEPLKPLTLPNQLITQSVPAKQSFQEFAMAGGGVPAQYKGREHVWHAKVNKHEVSMKKGGDPLDEFVPPRFRSAGRRPAGQDDRKASASMPVDFARGAISGALGAPGDIESLIRMLPGLDEKTVLPTSEDIEKRLPFRSDTPQGRMASGLGTLAGGFYTGPGAPIKAVGKAAKLAGEGLGALKGSGAGAKSLAGQRGVIKMPGGNFLTGRVEKDVKNLKRHVPEESEIENINRAAGQDVRYPMRQADIALNKWVDSNLSNYIKKQMATPDDPVRALAEQGITHKRNLLDEYPRDAENIKSERKAAGFPEEGMAQSPMAKAWERASDESLATHRAGDIQEMPGKFAKNEEAKTKMIAARDALDKKFAKHIKNLGLNSREVQNLIGSTSYTDKARQVGDTAFQQANAEYYATQSPMMGSYLALGQENPWISKVAPETTIYSPFTGDLGFDHIMDVLRQDLAAGRIRPEQMNKISISDAVRRTHQFDEDMAKKMAETQIKATEGMPVHKEYPEGYKWIELAQSKELPAGMKETVDKRYLRNEAGELVEDPRYKSLESALKYEGETMGHCVGGYCPDVSQGKSRIFSLRSAKGEPHVTIEVQPKGATFSDVAKYIGKEEAERLLDEGVTLSEMIKNIPDFQYPQRIQQIKGKQNRAPKEEYLPYVQDFVKGGKWADVGDIQNTGLYSTKDIGGLMPQSIQMSRNARTLALGRARRAGELPEYMTRDEYEAMLQKHVPEDIWAAEKAQRAAEDDELLQQLRPPEEGMRAGGAAKAAKGAKKAIELGIDEVKALLGMAKEAPAGVEPIVVKPAERAAAGKKAAELIKSQPKVKASEALGQAMEKGFKKTTTTQADRTRVGGGNIGGAPFSAISEADPAYAGKVWGVMDEGTAARLKNLTDPETAWTTMLGSASQLKTNPIVFDKLKKGFLESIKEGNLPPELEAKINHNLALTFGEGAEIRDPKIWKQADTFEKRAALADLMMGQGIAPGKGGVALGGEKSGKGVIFKPTDILKRETEPGLLHPEHGGSALTYAAGPRLFSLDPVSEYRPDLHPGFPTLIGGKDLGVNMIPTPTEVYLPDWHRSFKKANPERKGPGYYDLALGVKGEGLPSQKLDDEYIRHLLREGYKKGGRVGGLSATTKSCSCHD